MLCVKIDIFKFGEYLFIGDIDLVFYINRIGEIIYKIDYWLN